MKKIYFYLILVYSVNFYANDTTTVVSLKNRNLREKANIDSKILSEIKTNDTLKLTSIENNWAKVIYKDSLNGYVKNEFLKVIKNEQAEILELKKMKLFFFKTLSLIFITLFGFLYLLKCKTSYLKNTDIIFLFYRSTVIAFIITIISLIYSYYDNLSIFQIIGVIFFMLVIFYVFFFELLSDDISENEYLKAENIQATSIDKYITEINTKLKDLNSKYNQIEVEIFEILVDEFGEENSNNLVKKLIPIVGMPYEVVIHYFGEPEKINESSDSNNIWQTFFYDKMNNRGNDGTWRLKIQMRNNILEKYEIR